MVLVLDFESRLALHVKQDKDFNCQFKDCLEKYDFFANDFKHRHFIYHWTIFFTIKNLRLLPQNKSSFGSDQLAKFCIGKCIDDPGTFFTNRGYYWEEEVEGNLLVPRTGGGYIKRRRCNFEKP